MPHDFLLDFSKTGVYLQGMEHGAIARLARKVGRDRAVISRMLNGKSRPTWEIAKKLALLCGNRPEFWLEAAPAAMREAVARMERKDDYA